MFRIIIESSSCIHDTISLNFVSDWMLFLVWNVHVDMGFDSWQANA
jgi:hypothetical protein